MSKHTPGPWRIAENDGAYAYIKSGPGTNLMKPGQMVAKVWLQDADYNEANARLIAAAPELLEACKQLLTTLEEAEQAHVLIGHWGQDAQREFYNRPEIKLLVRALAKAEGNE